MITTESLYKCLFRLVSTRVFKSSYLSWKARFSLSACSMADWYFSLFSRLDDKLRTLFSRSLVECFMLWTERWSQQTGVAAAKVVNFLGSYPALLFLLMSSTVDEI